MIRNTLSTETGKKSTDVLHLFIHKQLSVCQIQTLSRKIIVSWINHTFPINQSETKKTDERFRIRNAIGSIWLIHACWHGLYYSILDTTSSN